MRIIFLKLILILNQRLIFFVFDILLKHYFGIDVEFLLWLWLRLLTDHFLLQRSFDFGGVHLWIKYNHTRMSRILTNSSSSSKLRIFCLFWTIFWIEWSNEVGILIFLSNLIGVKILSGFLDLEFNADRTSSLFWWWSFEHLYFVEWFCLKFLVLNFLNVFLYLCSKNWKFKFYLIQFKECEFFYFILNFQFNNMIFFIFLNKNLIYTNKYSIILLINPFPVCGNIFMFLIKFQSYLLQSLI